MTAAVDRLLHRLEWQILRRLDGRLQGAYRTPWRGSGLDFTDLRPYTAEDDVRHIDWNVTARLDEPYVRQYTEDRDLTCWLVVDRSASMRYADAPRGKDALAHDIAVAVARLIARGGNRVGAVLYDDNRTQRIVPPRTGRRQTLRLAYELTRPAADAAPGRGATTDLAQMLRLAARTARRRSLVVVISDFIGDPGWERPLAMLAHRHEVAAVRVVDPVELDLPNVGLVLVEDAETGEQVLVDTGDPLLRGRLADAVRQREEALAAAMRRAGVSAHRVTTDAALATVLIELVRSARRRR